MFSIGTIPLPLYVHSSELNQRSLTVTPTSSFLGGHDFASSAEKIDYSVWRPIESHIWEINREI